MWTLILIMLGAGFVGGVVNVALNETVRTGWTWFTNVLAGIAAAFLVPLFLSTMDSTLIARLDESEATKESYLILGGFCLLAAISSRSFIQSLSNKVLQEAKEAKRVSEDAHRESAHATDVARSAHLLAEVAQDSAIYDLGVGKVASKNEDQAMRADLQTIEHGRDPEDPWAGQFGGNSVAEGRELIASISRDRHRPDWRVVSLKVRSVDGIPLVGTVTFYLHPSFRNTTPVVPVINGVASLSMATWGAFTVGAVVDQGNTKLELNLADHPEADEPWRSR